MQRDRPDAEKAHGGLGLWPCGRSAIPTENGQHRIPGTSDEQLLKLALQPWVSSDRVGEVPGAMVHRGERGVGELLTGRVFESGRVERGLVSVPRVRLPIELHEGAGEIHRWVPLEAVAHDARHHWAVENIRAGVPVELVARQLGHKDAVMVLKIYGRFAPKDAEWGHWRTKVQEMQAKRAAEAAHGTKGGTGDSGLISSSEEKTLASGESCEGYDDSRGGTRTRDPGIMSAVL